MAIHKIEVNKQRGIEHECYVIASGGLWLPGAYDTERAAKYAFRFPNETLVKLRNMAIERGGNRCITFEDLQKERGADRVNAGEV